MSRKAAQGTGPRAVEIADAARCLLEDEGADGLTMRAVAQRLGIRAPSLYRHFPDKAALEAAVISTGLQEQGRRFAEAIDGADDPVAAVGQEYRRFAHEHPHLYRLMYTGSLARDRLAAGAEEAPAAPLSAAVGHDRERARAVLAFAHGMVLLEMDGRFPPWADVDGAWESGLAALSPARRRVPDRGGS